MRYDDHGHILAVWGPREGQRIDQPTLAPVVKPALSIVTPPKRPDLRLVA